MKINLSNVIFFVKQTQRNKARQTTKNKEGKINKKQGINKKNKKQERQRVKMEKWKKPRRKKGRHWEMNKITCFQGKTVFLQKTQKHKILRRVEGQQPQNTRAGFYLLSLWSPHGHVSSSYTLFIAKVSFIFFFSFGVLFFFFLVVVFRFVFPFLSLLCSLFLSLLFIFLHFLCVTKKPDQITEYLKCSFWFSAVVPASSHFHLAQLRTPTRTREPPLKMVLDSFLWFLTMCWNTYFYSVSWTSTRISPNQNGP